MYCEFTVYDDDNYDPEYEDSYEPEEVEKPRCKHYRYFTDTKDKMFQAILATYEFKETPKGKKYLLSWRGCSAVITLNDDLNRFDLINEDGIGIEAETWETLPELLEILEENLTLETESNIVDYTNPWYVEQLR